MGGILKSIRHDRNNRSNAYSLKKQSTWQKVDELNAAPTPSPLGSALPVRPSDFCHCDANLIVIR